MWLVVGFLSNGDESTVLLLKARVFGASLLCFLANEMTRIRDLTATIDGLSCEEQPSLSFGDCHRLANPRLGVSAAAKQQHT
jgi:hypothetical protein